MFRILVVISVLSFALDAQCEIYGFSSIPSVFQKTSDAVEVKNMPPVRSQDTIGICYTFAPSALLEHEYCREEKLDCSQIDDSQRPSVLALTKYAVDGQTLSDSSDPNLYPKQLRSKLTYGMDVLQNVFLTKMIPKESCAPFDSLVSKIGNPASQQKAKVEMWNQVKSAYDTYKSKFK
ncbi:MAG: hypothetical protein EOP06_14260, partial [Proteobacteria bacterium]